MTQSDVVATIAHKLSQLHRQHNANENNRTASRIARLWQRIRKEHAALTSADFARLFDETVPLDFDAYWTTRYINVFCTSCSVPERSLHFRKLALANVASARSASPSAHRRLNG